MQSRALTNLLLLITVILLVLLVLFSTDNSDHGERLTLTDRNSITSITIPRPKGNIVLRKESGHWLMTTPYTLPAHEFRINQLLNLLDIEADKNYTTETLSLAQYGLEPPGATIIFNDIQIDFGTTNPVNNKRYIHSNGKLVLVEDKIFPLVSSQPSSFLDLALLPSNSSIRKLSLPGISLEKDTNSLWQTSSNKPFSADQTTQLVADWASAQAFGIHAYMPRKNLGKIEIELENNEKIIFEISDDKPWLILGRPELGIEYHLDNHLIEKLIHPEQGTQVTGDA